MKSIAILFTALITFTFFGCQEAGNENNTSKDTAKKEQTEKESHDHEGEMKPVELNNGERWQADKSTNAGIADMKKLMDQYESGEISDVQELNKQMKAEFQEIFAQCSMTGEAHNQLHNYLLPMKKLFEKIEDCQGAECDQYVATLEKHLGEYERYFE